MFVASLAGVRSEALQQTTADKVDAPLHTLFRTSACSDSQLQVFKESFGGHVPERKFWNVDEARTRLFPKSDVNEFGVKTVSFGLKEVVHRDWKLAKLDIKKKDKGIDPLAPEPQPISELRATLREGKSASMPHLLGQGQNSAEPPPLTRADKYYQALIKADRKRKEFVRKRDWEEHQLKAGRAADKAKKFALKQDTGMSWRHEAASASSKSDSDEDSEEEDPGPVQPYPGLMRVEVEVSVMRAPGDDASDTDESTEKGSEVSIELEEEKDDLEEDVDWAAELQELQEEFGEPEEKEESEAGSVPEGLAGRMIPNIHDNSEKRTALGLGGTAFFVPEVERYAMAPSLLPPPPRGEGHLQQIGPKRLKLKPRLPLEVSRNRWRDEHPYGCPPEQPFAPGLDEYRTWEEKVRRVELYGTLNKFLSTMPKPDGIRKLPQTDNFEKALDWELRNSAAWQQYIKRQRLIELAREGRAGSQGSKRNPEETQQLLQGYTPGKPSSAPDPDKGLKPEDVQQKEKKDYFSDKKPDPIVKPKPKPLPPHPGAPPLKMVGPPPFQVGISPPTSPAGSITRKKPGLMSVAGTVRKGAEALS